jgi:hypothetical protein
MILIYARDDDEAGRALLAKLEADNQRVAYRNPDFWTEADKPEVKITKVISDNEGVLAAYNEAKVKTEKLSKK